MERNGCNDRSEHRKLVPNYRRKGTARWAHKVRIWGKIASDCFYFLSDVENTVDNWELRKGGGVRDLRREEKV